MSFSRRMENTRFDESLSETSEYQSDNGEVIEDISNGPISSTPSTKRVVSLRKRFVLRCFKCRIYHASNLILITTR